jgi:hypothetical protein
MKKYFAISIIVILSGLGLANIASAASKAEGYIERIDNMTVIGWAYDNGQPLDIQAKLQETTSKKIYNIQTQGPFSHRDDICNYLATKYGYQGTCNPLFGIYFGYDLPGGTYRILSGTFNGKKLTILKDAKNPYTKPVVGPKIGYIDYVNQGNIQGWAYDSGESNINLEFTIRNVADPSKMYTLTGKLKSYREDVANFIHNEFAVPKSQNLNAFYLIEPTSVIKENGRYEILYAYFNKIDFKFSNQKDRFFDVTIY